MDKESASLDILGVKPISEAALHASKTTIDGAASFLGKICLPAATEFGLLLQDKVRAWRAENALKVVDSARQLLQSDVEEKELHAHPRIVALALEQGSWSDEESLQRMWAGILASSCCRDGRDDSNLVFVSLLSNLTGMQIRILEYACSNAKKEVDLNGLIIVRLPVQVDVATLLCIAESGDIHRVDRELDHLRGLGLINVGFEPGSTQVDITPSALAINLYVRCKGFRGSAAEYFGINAERNGVGSCEPTVM